MIGRRKAPRAFAVALPALGLALAAHTGWLTAPKRWPEATGWDRLSPAERPPQGPLWSADAGGGEPPRLDWLGHSGFRLRWRETSLLLDPNLSARCTLARRELEPAPAPARIGPVDAVLVSHAHFDHLDLPTLAALPSVGRVVVPAGSESYVPARAGRETVGLAVGESIRVGELEVIAVPAAHNGNRLHPLASRRLAVGYVVRGVGGAVYFAGDTGFGNDFEAIAARYRPRVALLPIGAFAPRWPMRYYHLSPEEAVAAAERLGAETVVPCHFGTFTLSWDRPDGALPRFARAARARGLDWRMPRLLGGGAMVGRPEAAAR